MAVSDNLKSVQEEQETGEKRNVVYEVYSKGRQFVSALIAVFITLLSVGIVFVVSSLEGTKEIKASTLTSAKILEVWRETEGVGDGIFPEERAIFIHYDNKDYYFVIDERTEDGAVSVWHFSYDGGFDYIFKDYKFYALTSLTIFVSLYVISVNYKSSAQKAMKALEFQKSQEYYQKNKAKVSQYTQYLPYFCSYKNLQTREDEMVDIITDSGLTYKEYKDKTFDIKTLEKWQRKTLKKIRKIKVIKIKMSSILQEGHSRVGIFKNKISILPESMRSHYTKYMITSFVSKFVSIGLGGVVAGVGVVIGNWQLGVTYGTMVVSSAISAGIVATDFVLTTLRARYVAKGDLLNEFDNIKQRFIDEELNKNTK